MGCAGPFLRIPTYLKCCTSVALKIYHLSTIQKLIEQFNFVYFVEALRNTKK